MGSGLSKLGAALIIIFAVLVVALIAQLFYVFWRHRVFRRQTNTVNGRGDIGDELSQYSSSDSTFSASKEQLLYFFCVRPDQFRLDGNSTDNTITSDHYSSQRSPKEAIDIDLLKIQGVFGPPRFLFTLKEEEKGNQESSTDKSLYAASTGKGENQRIGDGDDNRSNLNYLKEHFQAGEDSAVVVGIDDGGPSEFDTTPFSTPCASPVYFTPSASPVHEVVNGRSPEAVLRASKGGGVSEV